MLIYHSFFSSELFPTNIADNNTINPANTIKYTGTTSIYPMALRTLPSLIDEYILNTENVATNANIIYPIFFTVASIYPAPFKEYIVPSLFSILKNFSFPIFPAIVTNRINPNIIANNLILNFNIFNTSSLSNEFLDIPFKSVFTTIIEYIAPYTNVAIINTDK